MKLLVTGGLGFIRKQLLQAILQAPDYELINVDKIGMGANPANLHDIENDKRYTFIKGDICNPLLMNRVIHQVDAVVNIAAETHVDRSISAQRVSSEQCCWHFHNFEICRGIILKAGLYRFH
jgi:dTDP-glucose 4,6-dehydratase